MTAFLAKETWRPVWWEPVLQRGAPWLFTVTLKGPGLESILGGHLLMNGRQYPLQVHGGMITARLEPEDVEATPDNSAAQAYLELADVGQVLWLNGKVTRGGD